ncbi:MAG: prepilin-type N-terminal cleavage/methylation domain-containing protein [bacterium]
MKNKKIQLITLYLVLLAGIFFIAAELYAFYFQNRMVMFSKLRTIALILWFLSFIWLIEKPRIVTILLYIVILIGIIGFFIFSPLFAVIIAGIGALGIAISKLASEKKRFVGKLFVDLGLIIAGISLLVMGLSYLKFQSVPDLVPFLFILAAISFGLGIIFTSITTPQRALIICFIITGIIGSLFVIGFGVQLLASYFAGYTEYYIVFNIVASIMITLVVLGIESVIYLCRRSKFTWLWLLTILLGIPGTGLGPGVGIVIMLMAIGLFPHWRDLYRYLFPKWIRIPYRENISEAIQTSKSQPQSGFTLIELLIVIAIVAIISVGLISTFGFALWGIRHSELQTQAVCLAQSELDYLRTLPYIQLNDETYTSLRGLKSTPMPEAISQVKLETTADGLKKATVRIKWYEGAQVRQIELVTLIAKK